MFAFLQDFLSTRSLSPHGICLTWRPELIWTHVASDAVIGLAYFSIPVALGTFVSRRRDIAFGGLFWSFAVFILACGTTHFMSIWTLWVPDYGLEALVKVMTAFASILTAGALWWLLPKALALPSPADLRHANEALTRGIAERDSALRALAEANTERQRAEEMLRQSQKMEAIGQFTGGVAHDFNNLLAIIVANLDRLGRRVQADEKSGKAVAHALEAARRAAALIHALLAFARRQPLLPSDVKVNDLLASMAPLLEDAIEGKRVILRPGPVALVRVDPSQLENALLNVAVNARDAMMGDGALIVTTRMLMACESSSVSGLAVGHYVVVEMRDEGVGMPAAVAERAFEPFFTTKAIGQGTGLGLSQVYGFATQSGGTARITSEVGRGTTVTLYLSALDEASGDDAVAVPKRLEPFAV